MIWLGPGFRFRAASWADVGRSDLRNSFAGGGGDVATGVATAIGVEGVDFFSPRNGTQERHELILLAWVVTDPEGGGDDARGMGEVGRRDEDTWVGDRTRMGEEAVRVGDEGGEGDSEWSPDLFMQDSAS